MDGVRRRGDRRGARRTAARGRPRRGAGGARDAPRRAPPRRADPGVPRGHAHDRRTRRGGRTRGPRRRGRRPGHRAADGQEPPDADRRRGPDLGAARVDPGGVAAERRGQRALAAAVLRGRPGRLRDDADRPPRAGCRRAALGAGPGHPRRRPLPGWHRRHQRGRGRRLPGRRVRLRAPAGRDGLEAPQADDEPRQRGPGLLHPRAGRRRPGPAGGGRGRGSPGCGGHPGRRRRARPRAARRPPAGRPVAGRERGGGSSWQSLRRATGSIETDYLNGEVVRLGRLHGVPTPANALLQATARRLAATGGEPGSVPAADLLARLA